MVFTDGSCQHFGKSGYRAGQGVWWNQGHELNLSERVRVDKQTSTVAEIQAIISAMSAKRAGTEIMWLTRYPGQRGGGQAGREGGLEVSLKDLLRVCYV